MPRYYCDYCDIYLTHDYLSARKQHNKGFRHKANVRSYYQQFEARLNQTLVDQKIKEHIGQAGVFQQYGAAAAYNQMRPHIAPFLTPMMPGFRPPMFPTPVPGYVSGPGVPPMMAPPGGGGPPHFTSQSSSCYGGLQGHQTMSTLTSVPGIASVPTGGGGGSSTHSMANFVTYQLNTANATRSGCFDGGDQASEATR